MANKMKSRVHKTRTPGIYKVDPSRVLHDGGYEVRYRDGFNKTRRKTFKTKQEALNFQAAVRTDKRRGDFIEPRRGQTRFGSVAEDWYAAQRHWKPRTRESARSILDRYILPAFGDKAIGRIDAPAVRKFMAALPEHLSPTSRRNIARILSPIFKQAVEDRIIRSNPVQLVKLPKAGETEMLFLTAEEIAALADAIAPEYRTLVYFAAMTGARAGECAALRVKDLNMLRGRVTIARSVSEVSRTITGSGSRLHYGPPKNGKTRALSIPPVLRDMLAAHLAKRPHRPDDLVFTAKRGEPMRWGNFMLRHFRPAVERALPEKPRLRFHDLRHSHASQLIALGVHPKAIQQRLGHSSVSITMDTYGHLYDDHEEPIVAGLEATFAAAASD